MQHLVWSIGNSLVTFSSWSHPPLFMVGSELVLNVLVIFFGHLNVRRCVCVWGGGGGGGLCSCRSVCEWTYVIATLSQWDIFTNRYKINRRRIRRMDKSIHLHKIAGENYLFFLKRWRRLFRQTTTAPGLVYGWVIKSSPPSVAYIRKWTESALVQVMACRLFGAKPLPEPMLPYCQLDYWEQNSVKFEWEFPQFHSRKCIWNCRLPKWRPFCPGRDASKKTTIRYYLSMTSSQLTHNYGMSLWVRKLCYREL